MKIAVVSYSLTGNNEAVAKRIAEKFSADHIKIKENKNRKTGTIITDMIFGKTPKVEPAPASLGKYDLLLLVGPVWLGQVASPFRSYLKYLKANPQKFAFISLSGGALNPNPKLAGDIKKRAGAEPTALIDLHIADLLPPEPKPTMKDTSAYRVIDTDLEKLVETIVKTISTVIPTTK